MISNWGVLCKYKGITRKIQIMQNKLVKLLLNLDRYTQWICYRIIYHSSKLKIFTNATFFPLSTISVQIDVQMCLRAITKYENKIMTVYILADWKFQRIELTLGNRCEVKGARQWNEYFNVTDKYLYMKSFHKHIRRVLKDYVDIYSKASDAELWCFLWSVPK